MVPEFYMNNTHMENNLQHGAFLENMRNYAYVNASELSSNMYGAGLKVYGGAGECLTYIICVLNQFVIPRENEGI